MKRKKPIFWKFSTLILLSIICLLLYNNKKQMDISLLDKERIEIKYLLEKADNAALKNALPGEIKVTQRLLPKTLGLEISNFSGVVLWIGERMESNKPKPFYLHKETVVISQYIQVLRVPKGAQGFELRGSAPENEKPKVTQL